MSLALNKSKLDNLAGDIWKSAERLSGKFKAYEYQNVILPIIVIRRLECVLIDWREKKAAEVLARRPKPFPVQVKRCPACKKSRCKFNRQRTANTLQSK